MKVLQKITSVFLATVFLFSSLGFTISSMVCLKSGKQKISLAKLEDCCAKKVETSATEKRAILPLSEGVMSFEKGNCCDINSYTFNLTDFQNSQKLSLEKGTVLQSFFISSKTIVTNQVENKLAFQYSDLPPPLYGRTLLNFISTLTI